MANCQQSLRPTYISLTLICQFLTALLVQMLRMLIFIPSDDDMRHFMTNFRSISQFFALYCTVTFGLLNKNNL